MDNRETLETCRLDMEKCISEMGNEQELLNRLHETGFYDSGVIMEALNKIGELHEKLDNIKTKLQELKDKNENK